jgi:hypothetical protein
MKTFVVAAALALATVTGVSAQEAGAGACEGLVTGNQVGVDYEGHCILVEPEKGPVQGVFVRRVEDLDGVTLEGVVIMHTADGWELVEDEFIEPVEGDVSNIAVGDGWHRELDPTDG